MTRFQAARFHLHSSPTVAGDQQDLTTKTSLFSNETANKHLATAQLLLPSFLAKYPGAWFSQAEAQFHLCRITSQSARDYHVVISLPIELVEDMGNILVASPADDAYDRFKAGTVACLSTACHHLHRLSTHHTAESESSRLRQLLNVKELGVRRPTQMLRSMWQLIGSGRSAA